MRENGNGVIKCTTRFQSSLAYLKLGRMETSEGRNQANGERTAGAGLSDRMRISSENNGAYGRPGASFEPVGAVQHQQVANGRRSMRAMELLSDSVIERRRNAPTWRMDSEKLNAT